ncbi:ATP-binding protein [Streptomyces pseudovenezuelae]|uniref:HD domain-containing protein n=1 Tax=Streptomyces pseudovenezuelae TaxID=67350 RepID=UPI0036E9996C
MMQPHDSSRPEIWRKPFSQDAYTDNINARDKFKRALLDMEDKVSQLAGEIARDLPDFTQHDISHAYALWEIADRIAGPELRLNPAEAFVLGGAILVHDLAMSRAAHQVSGKPLRDHREWPDALAREVRKKYGRPPHPLELASPPEDLAVKADQYLLRSLHAELAESLPTASWVTQDKSTAYLINDPELRKAYGRTIGKVAASHHWNSDDVTRHLSSHVGAPAFAPMDWLVDTLVLACLLRTADAAHLDASRAPDVLAAVRDLPPLSKEHWLFQSRIQRPYLKSGRLVFTAPDGFAADEIGSWWLAYETLSMVDEELRNTDSILSDNGRSPFAARGVANVESPKTFSLVAPCRDWEPVEAKVKVDDVAGLVRRLGGSELYGENWIVGLREIVTNACDAVKAREALSGYRGGRPFMGRVTVWLEEQEERIWLCCSDNGIGMSPNILGGKLLDFGNTSWLSSEVVRENPGLLASKFEPAGRFGIGFFSIFMMGRRVKVTSRPVSGGIADTWVLEFTDGVEHRPILRKATHEEQLDEPGTTISVQLDEFLCEEFFNDDSNATLLNARIRRVSYIENEFISLVDLIRYLLPAAEVDIWASNDLNGRDFECAVSKQEWVTMDGVKLVRRLFGLPDDGLSQDGSVTNGDDANFWRDGRYEVEEIATLMGNRLHLVHDGEGRVAGRIAMCVPPLMDYDFSYPDASIVTAGPARTSTSLRGVCGILLGRPHGAARDSALPLVSYSSMADWIEKEMSKLSSLSVEASEGWPITVAEMAWRLDRDANHLPCWRTKDGWLDYSGVVRWISSRDAFYVANPYTFRVEIGADDFTAEMNEDVLSFEVGRNVHLSMQGASINWPVNEKHGEDHPFTYMFYCAVGEAWGVEAAQSVQRSFHLQKGQRTETGSFEGRPIFSLAYSIVRE